MKTTNIFLIILFTLLLITPVLAEYNGNFEIYPDTYWSKQGESNQSSINPISGSYSWEISGINQYSDVSVWSPNCPEYNTIDFDYQFISEAGSFWYGNDDGDIFNEVVYEDNNIHHIHFHVSNSYTDFAFTTNLNEDVNVRLDNVVLSVTTVTGYNGDFEIYPDEAWQAGNFENSYQTDIDPISGNYSWHLNGTENYASVSLPVELMPLGQWNIVELDYKCLNTGGYFIIGNSSLSSGTGHSCDDIGIFHVWDYTSARYPAIDTLKITTQAGDDILIDNVKVYNVSITNITPNPVETNLKSLPFTFEGTNLSINSEEFIIPYLYAYEETYTYLVWARNINIVSDTEGMGVFDTTNNEQYNIPENTILKSVYIFGDSGNFGIDTGIDLTVTVGEQPSLPTFTNINPNYGIHNSSSDYKVTLSGDNITYWCNTIYSFMSIFNDTFSQSIQLVEPIEEENWCNITSNTIDLHLDLQNCHEEVPDFAIQEQPTLNLGGNPIKNKPIDNLPEKPQIVKPSLKYQPLYSEPSGCSPPYYGEYTLYVDYEGFGDTGLRFAITDGNITPTPTPTPTNGNTGNITIVISNPNQEAFYAALLPYILFIIGIVCCIVGIAVPLFGLCACIIALIGIAQAFNNSFAMGLLFFVLLLAGIIESVTSLW